MKTRHMIAALALVAAGSTIGVGGVSPARAQGGQAQLSYAEDVAPVLRERCTSCHHPGGEGTSASGLDLSSYAGLMNGTKFGKMVIPGDPENSNLMRLLDWQVSPQIRMPHGKKQLSVCDRDAIRTWIRQGAKDN